MRLEDFNMLMVLLRMVLLMSIVSMIVFVVKLAHDLVFEWDKERDKSMWVICFVLMVIMLCGITSMTMTLVFTLQIM